MAVLKQSMDLDGLGSHWHFQASSVLRKATLPGKFKFSSVSKLINERLFCKLLEATASNNALRTRLHSATTLPRVTKAESLLEAGKIRCQQLLDFQFENFEFLYSI